MIYENLCINCMKEKPIANGVCPHCGFDNTKYSAADFHLPLYTQLSNGRYIVGKAIGSGGFGITYIAFDIRLKVPVAIKELFVSDKVRRDHSRTVLMNTTESGIRQYEEIKRRFMQEARTIAELENIDGIVKVKDFFQANDTAYIVMEYLDGKNLKEILQENKKRMPLSQVVSLLEPVMISLSKMHKSGIIHRDISLDNIMVTKDGRVKLIDLGGEKRLGESGDSDKTVAIKKSAYTPIEQVLGKSSDIGPWTDVYALAVTIYRCICGRFPKRAGDRVDDKDIEKPGKLGVRITKKQEETLLKALALNKKNRLQTVDLLLDGLKEPKKKSRLPIIIAILSVLLAGGAGGYFLFRANSPAVIEGGTYVIANYVNPDLVLEIPSDYYEPGSSVVLGKTDNSNAQKFYIKERDRGSYYLSAVCSDHSLTQYEKEDTGIEDLVQAEFSEQLDNEQSWYFENAGKGTYNIRSGTGLYIACHNDNVAAEVNVELTENNQNDETKWVLISTQRNKEDTVTPVAGTVIGLEEGYYKITPRVDLEQKLTALEDEKWGTRVDNDLTEQKFFISDNETEGNTITAALNNRGLAGAAAEQSWKFVFARQGSYFIQNADGRVLTLNQDDGSVGLAEPVGEGEDDISQRWYVDATELNDIDQLNIILAEKKSYYIINRTNYDLCVAARNDSAQEGTILQLIQKDSGLSQDFTFEEVEKGKYKIINEYSGNVISFMPEIDNYARLMTGADSGDQLWSFEAAENGYYYIKSAEGYYLGVDLNQNTSLFYDAEPNKNAGFQWKIMTNNK